MSRLILALVALLSLGCSGSYRPMTELHVSTRFRLAEQEAIVQAADDVCAQGGPCIPVIIGESKTQWIRPSSKCRPGKAAQTQLEVLRRPRIKLCYGDVYLMTLHELGHALGARGDHLGPGNMMHHEADAEALTEADLRYMNSNRKGAP